ncbi:hypothetical protein [Roseinatronobacter alkalisoli]|uniref:Aldehyde dehydrogenase family protein n=1 Tax=Roseinatronobacter alkalisoli TaxID=3028235 RepID=A0ABT5T936_9RHOB|nr:hypothetical protein [Roseinatronobacter sp. HJB301]MDD7971225.1 hypothetical protein [Roseinatronobacter sp. HJB301]
MYEDFSERLFTHYVGGAWRAPLGTRAIPVVTLDGRVAGQVIAAEPADIARLCKGLRGADTAALARFSARVAQAADDLAQALAMQGACPDRTAMVQLGAGIGASDGNMRHPVCLHGSVRQAPQRFGQRLGQGLACGLVYCPPANEALFATLLTCLAAEADMPPGAFNLLHGDPAQTLSMLAQADVPCLQDAR